MSRPTPSSFENSTPGSRGAYQIAPGLLMADLYRIIYDRLDYCVGSARDGSSEIRAKLTELTDGHALCQRACCEVEKALGIYPNVPGPLASDDEPAAWSRNRGAQPETLDTIADWCETTFGPITPERLVERAGEEFDELRAEPASAEEAADVVICLSRVPGLWAAVLRKMTKNRARRWRLMGDGTGYHVK